MSNFSYTYVSVVYFFTSKFHFETLPITYVIKGVPPCQLMQITIYQHFSDVMLNLQSLTNTHTSIHYLQ